MDSSQKLIARHRAPRVQIEYDVELNGARKKVSIPFTMGVMADLSGAAADELPPIDERKAIEFDVDHFNDRMEAIAPSLAFEVPNALTGEGQLRVDMSFRHMDDFLPEAVARRVAPLARLLEARTRLANLDAYLDGKAGAERLLAQALRDPALLAGLTSSTTDGEG
ncbi:type VI secretion system contractile sheath small subunit [Luteibacter aegosomatis]|uniref:type VI secretion system contractile sheath small subunit n=1 Tax=Luteibacter aegosomatis TaxID=2911537 RepID=UPI001FF78B12|nr:type VI secretion system contractile sheath small subunit [Luteibacter aegosomatis]UPG84782.1 type VI secretion system contractile sheath small subunit [Luteibacter aegosomatis]